MFTAKVHIEKKKLWTCPTCKRNFARHGQLHSCRQFPLEQHFKNKPDSTVLYQKLRQAVKYKIGSYKVESLECCIHFVSTFTFAAVKILKDKIRVDFGLSRKIRSKRFTYVTPMSTHRYLYCVDVMTEDDIDTELLDWIKEAHDRKFKTFIA
jgi:hypothetical protein